MCYEKSFPQVCVWTEVRFKNQDFHSPPTLLLTTGTSYENLHNQLFAMLE